MYRTDDPHKDFMRYEQEKRRIERKLPKCIHCEAPIWQETAVKIGGCWFCDECLDDNFRFNVEVDS